MVKNPAKPEEQQQICYQLGYTKMLFYKFHALEDIDCCYETFSRNVPYYVKKAGHSDWGTCLCRKCLNPELKVEKLIGEKFIPSINLECVIQNDDDYHDLLENIKLLEQKTSNLKISCVKWKSCVLCLIKGSLEKRQKFPEKKFLLFLCDFAKKLAIELAVLKDHLHRAHMQYRAFKIKRMEAEKSSDTVTFQIDWSKNASIRRAQEEKPAYYHNDQISIHCIHSWSSKGQKLFAAISNH